MISCSEAQVLARVGDPFPGAADDQPGVRIPALAVLPTGRVVCVYDIRLRDQLDLPGPIDLAIIDSDDHGHTWSEPRVLRRRETTDDGRVRGFGDASLTALPDGRLICWYTGVVDHGFWEAEAGPEGAGPELWCAISDDQGRSWQHRQHTAELKPADITGIFTSSGNGTVIEHGPHQGRVLQPLVMRDPAEQHFTAAAISDDRGETWHVGERVGPDCDETKLLALADGEVLLHGRATPRRRTARSHDGGETFTQPVIDPALVDPHCNGGLCTWGDWVVSTLCSDEAARVGLTLRASTDGGRTWQHTVVISDQPAAYSVAAELADGSLAVVWEHGDCTELRLVRLTR